MSQPDLFAEPATPRDPEPKARPKPQVGAFRARARTPHPHDLEAADFHAEHPEVYRLFAARARQAIAMGQDKFSARTIWEVLRWETTVGDHAAEFRLNDHYVPWYARRFLREPDCPEGFFEVRR